MRIIGVVIAILFLFSIPGCAGSQKVKLRDPLSVGRSVPTVVIQFTDQGMAAYRKMQFQAAKSYFEQAVAGAPNSAEAHYNLGLALFALGDGQAREHFIEAANLAPGNKVIWDSPALHQFGDPEPTLKKTGERPYSTRKPSFGGTGPR